MKTTKMCPILLMVLGLSFETASGNSLLVLGRHASMKQTVIVSPGSTEIESGSNLVNALASVTGSAAQPYIIKIEPGTYHISGTILYMKPYVDIEGSGQGITVIKKSQINNGVVRGSSNAEIRELTVVNTYDGEEYGCYGIVNSEESPVIRNVTVEVLGGCDLPFGILNYQSSPVLIGVSAYVAGSGNTYGIRDLWSFTRMENVFVESATSGADSEVWGVYIYEGGTAETPTTLENVRVTAIGGKTANGLEAQNSRIEANNLKARALDADYNNGIHLSSSEPATIVNSFASASGGFYGRGIEVYNASASFVNVSAAAEAATVENIGFRSVTALSSKTIRIDQSRISGNSYSIRNLDSDYTMYVGASKLDGAVSTTGTWHCVHCYDGDNIKLTETCQ